VAAAQPRMAGEAPIARPNLITFMAFVDASIAPEFEPGHRVREQAPFGLLRERIRLA
jgi:hypothetical protein